MNRKLGICMEFIGYHVIEKLLYYRFFLIRLKICFCFDYKIGNVQNYSFEHVNYDFARNTFRNDKPQGLLNESMGK